MRLAHLWLGKFPFLQAAHLQAGRANLLLAHKASQLSRNAPDGLVITFEPSRPIYTLGNRQAASLSPDEVQTLSANGEADVQYTNRGGLTTFHGPGQMVAYCIVDLLSFPSSTGLRNYVKLLETAGIATLGRFGLQGITTENTGVWIDDQRKIAAIGVHARRNVTTHGIAINVETNLRWFKRIVACGLEGKETTSFHEEGVSSITVGDVADRFVQELATAIRGDRAEAVDIYSVDRSSIGD